MSLQKLKAIMKIIVWKAEGYIRSMRFKCDLHSHFASYLGTSNVSNEWLMEKQQ